MVMLKAANLLPRRFSEGFSSDRDDFQAGDRISFEVLHYRKDTCYPMGTDYLSVSEDICLRDARIAIGNPLIMEERGISLLVML
jgi:hypothetical protein